jgi:hypothetical protein
MSGPGRCCALSAHISALEIGVSNERINNYFPVIVSRSQEIVKIYYKIRAGVLHRMDNPKRHPLNNGESVGKQSIAPPRN